MNKMRENDMWYDEDGETLETVLCCWGNNSGSAALEQHSGSSQKLTQNHNTTQQLCLSVCAMKLKAGNPNTFTHDITLFVAAPFAITVTRVFTVVNDG